MKAIKPALFDIITNDLIKDLLEWWNEESLSLDSANTPPASGNLYDGLPAVDSKAVVRASDVVEKHIGVKLPPRLIRNGGYFSFDDLTKDLIPKLRVLCVEEESKAKVKTG